MEGSSQKITVCYFGIYKSQFSRNKIYQDGLRAQGIHIIECQDDSRGILKFFRLFKKHWKIRNDYDVLIVGYTGYITVPFARLISSKPIIFDALCSLYEAEVLSRTARPMSWFKKTSIKCIDWLAVKCAHKVLVESNPQKDFFVKRFNLDQKKVIRVLTGVDTSVFYPIETSKRKKFTAVFRGTVMEEAGIAHIVDAARILEAHDVDVIIATSNSDARATGIEEYIKSQNISTITFIAKYLSFEELRMLMQSCHVSLGQFADHVRLERTIPHKSYESLAMRLPYITAQATGVQDVFTDKENVLFCNKADPNDLANKILDLKSDAQLQASLAENGYALCQSTFTPDVLGKELSQLVAECYNQAK
ncbi:MAG: glycosyltransferase [Patescibacteria group bacterium]